MIAKIRALTKIEARYDMYQMLLTTRGYKDGSRVVMKATKEEKEKRKAGEPDN